MKYDDENWHLNGGNFPEGLPPEKAATHIGMYLKWCICKGLGSSLLLDDFAEETENVLKGYITGAGLLELLDGKFTADELCDLGNQFTQDYYEGHSAFSKEFDVYIDDYDALFDNENMTSLYQVEDTTANYERMAAKIDERFAQWGKYKNVDIEHELKLLRRPAHKHFQS